MGKKQIILLVFAIVTTMAIYLFFPVGTQNNNNNQAKGGAMRDQAPAEEKIFTIESYIAEVNAALTPDLKQKSTEFTSSIEKTNNFDQNIKDYTSLVDLYSKAEKPEIAAYYIYKKAQLIREPKVWEKSGDNFIALYADNLMEERLRKDVMKKAIDSYLNASNADTSNLDVKVKLAQCYMEGSNEVMNGVTLLLNVVQTNPSHYGANLLLGKFGIVSGQYEKAIARLEKVVSLQSEKIEGYFLLADAYAGNKNYDKAIETLSKAKKISKDKELIAQIDEAITQLKQKTN